MVLACLVYFVEVFPVLLDAFAEFLDVIRTHEG
jgi:hypothetical protein